MRQAAADLLACNNLGVLYEQGIGVAIDYVRARALYVQACEGGEPRGCHNLGVLATDGHGEPADPAAARAWFQRACDAGLTESCPGAAP